MYKCMRCIKKYINSMKKCYQEIAALANKDFSGGIDILSSIEDTLDNQAYMIEMQKKTIEVKDAKLKKLEIEIIQLKTMLNMEKGENVNAKVS